MTCFITLHLGESRTQSRRGLHTAPLRPEAADHPASERVKANSPAVANLYIGTQIAIFRDRALAEPARRQRVVNTSQRVILAAGPVWPGFALNPRGKHRSSDENHDVGVFSLTNWK